MVDIDLSELDRVQRKLDRLEENLEKETRREVDRQVGALIRAIREEIIAEGLVETGELLASFESQQDGKSHWIIYSTADHARPLEEGASPHTIEPDRAQVLSWIPENPADYPEHYDPETGRVYIDSVNHPGNRAYRYILGGQEDWAPIMRLEVETVVHSAIIESGFRRTG